MSEFIGFTNRYHVELQQEVDRYTEIILNGNLPDYTEYKRLVALRQATLHALERHKQLLSLMEQALEK
jgi:hypothetical protein